MLLKKRLTNIRKIQMFLRRKKIKYSIASISKCLSKLGIIHKNVKHHFVSKKSSNKAKKAFRKNIVKEPIVYMLLMKPDFILQIILEKGG